MLRHRLSSGILRAQSIASHTSHPPVPSLPLPLRISTSSVHTNTTQSVAQRGLASAVLLSSENKGGRGKWGLETVKGLREALSQRGLTTTGNKSTLIQRLESYESSPTPPSKRSHNRRISSSTIASAPSKKIPTPTSPPSDSSTLVPPDAVVSDNKSIPGLSTDEVKKLAEPDISVAPGLPESAAAKNPVQRGKVEGIQLPTYEETGEQLAIPPFTPDNFSSTAEHSMSPPTSTERTDSSNPKVMTVASTSTHIDAGPSHSLFETHDHDSSAPDADALKEASEKIPSLYEVINSVSIPSVKGMTGVDIMETIKMPEIGEGQEFKPIERGLNEEEKWGAWILAAIVGTGLVLGGGGKTEEEKAEARKRKEEKKEKKKQA